MAEGRSASVNNDFKALPRTTLSKALFGEGLEHVHCSFVFFAHFSDPFPRLGRPSFPLHLKLFLAPLLRGVPLSDSEARCQHFAHTWTW